MHKILGVVCELGSKFVAVVVQHFWEIIGLVGSLSHELRHLKLYEVNMVFKGNRRQQKFQKYRGKQNITTACDHE